MGDLSLIGSCSKAYSTMPGAPETVPYAEPGDPQTLNLYAYGRNNPVPVVDADGHTPLDWIWEQTGHMQQEVGFGFHLWDGAREGAGRGSGCPAGGCTVTVTAPTPPAIVLQGVHALQSWASRFGAFGRQAILNVPTAGVIGASILYSRIKGERGMTGSANASNNPTKKARPVRDQSGKIVGWKVRDPHTGRWIPKNLDWGTANGLDPATYRATAVAAGGAAAFGITGVDGLGIAGLLF